LVAGFKGLLAFGLLENDATLFYFTEGFVKGICVHQRLTKPESRSWMLDTGHWMEPKNVKAFKIACCPSSIQ